MDYEKRLERTAFVQPEEEKATGGLLLSTTTKWESMEKTEPKLFSGVESGE